MPDIRNERTRQAIKEALRMLLQAQSLDSIPVSAVAKQAGVSRSTFYGHFQNTYEVYKLLVKDFLSSVSVIEDQLKCSECAAKADKKQPYCVAVRSTEKYRGVVRDKQYLSTMLGAYQEGPFSESALAAYLKLGLDESSAKDLVTFQMAGCHMVACSGHSDVQWPQKKQLLDTFIAGGMNAVRESLR